MGGIVDARKARQETLKQLIREIHDGASVEDVKARFAALISGISGSEISEMEQALINEGLPVSEVQRMCDVHAAVFMDSIQPPPPAAEKTPGHPVHTFTAENEALAKLLDEIEAMPDDLSAKLGLLWDIDKHYSRKENLLFPFLEKHGIDAPPKVMWGVDDEIRAKIKAARAELAEGKLSGEELRSLVTAATTQARDMIFKEENILFPMALEHLTQEEWLQIAQESDAIGYCLVAPEHTWQPEGTSGEEDAAHGSLPGGQIRLSTGRLSLTHLEAMLDHLPFDITFVDADDIVRYYSNGPERIFVRTRAVIGRHVSNCHPPHSVHVVEQLLADFKAGRKDSEDFWLQKGGLFIYIRYFAVRSEQGEYLGTLEVTQNIAPLRALSDEKRIL